LCRGDGLKQHYSNKIYLLLLEQLEGLENKHFWARVYAMATVHLYQKSCMCKLFLQFQPTLYNYYYNVTKEEFNKSLSSVEGRDAAGHLTMQFSCNDWETMIEG